MIWKWQADVWAPWKWLRECGAQSNQRPCDSSSLYNRNILFPRATFFSNLMLLSSVVNSFIYYYSFTLTGHLLHYRSLILGQGWILIGEQVFQLRFSPQGSETQLQWFNQTTLFFLPWSKVRRQGTCSWLPSVPQAPSFLFLHLGCEEFCSSLSLMGLDVCSLATVEAKEEDNQENSVHVYVRTSILYQIFPTDFGFHILDWNCITWILLAGISNKI